MQPVEFNLLKALLQLLMWCALCLGGGYAAYFLLSLPFRRNERARLFLDLIEHSLNNNETLERAVQSVSQSRERSVGARFHLLAAHLEKGLTFEQALAKVPRLLPPPVAEMLRAGMELGNMRAVLPACRQLLKDGGTQVRKAQSYLIVLLFVVGPSVSGVIGVLNVFVMPKFEAIFADMMETVPFEFYQLVRYQTIWNEITLVVAALVWAGAFLYVGGPRVVEWLDNFFPGLYDSLVLRLPWRRKRFQRDFAAMLAVLLDAGLPEEKAVARAAQCTANRAFARRAERVVADLRAGVKLTEAVRHLDDAGEFRWRLANAARGENSWKEDSRRASSNGDAGQRASVLDCGGPPPLSMTAGPAQPAFKAPEDWRTPKPGGESAVHGTGHFTAALAGWQESLDARAFQQEQAATHLITTALVFWNGLIVAATTWCVFKFLTDLIWEGTTW
jgi:Flp pilus assembly protein TadB